MIIGKLELYIILSYVMELLFCLGFCVLQVKRVTKLRSQQKPSLWMQQQTVPLPKIESFVFCFIFQPPRQFWYFVQSIVSGWIELVYYSV
jgi:hypothetical protein